MASCLPATDQECPAIPAPTCEVAMSDRIKDAYEFLRELGVVLVTLILMPLAAIFTEREPEPADECEHLYPYGEPKF
jgi:hypothetical protein